MVNKLNTPLVLFPQASPPRGQAWYTCVTFRCIFRKKLHALPCPCAEDCANQEYRDFFEIHSSDYLTYRTLLGYFSDVAVSFF